MKKWLVFPVLCILFIVCIKPERDNEYDPNNLNKAYLEGNVYGFDGMPLQDARISLLNADSSDTLTIHGVETRYPGNWQPIEATEMNKVVELAKEFSKILLSKLEKLEESSEA